MADRLVVAAHVNISVYLFSRAHVLSAAGVTHHAAFCTSCTAKMPHGQTDEPRLRPPPASLCLSLSPSLALRTPGISRRIANASRGEPTTVLPKPSAAWGMGGWGGVSCRLSFCTRRHMSGSVASGLWFTRLPRQWRRWKLATKAPCYC